MMRSHACSCRNHRFNLPGVCLRKCTLLGLLLAVGSGAAASPPADNSRGTGSKSPHGFTILSNAAAWQRLPQADAGTGLSLPRWARCLADALPRTTAAMLELDYLHRTRSPIEAVLRGKMRWIAARANGCANTAACAADDLRRLGLKPSELEALKGDFAGLSRKDAAALNFARKLTIAADTVTDAEVAELVGHYGAKTFAAMVLLLAHANFQDRIVLSLGLSPAVQEPLRPVEVRFKRKLEKKDWPSVPPRRAPDKLQPVFRFSPKEDAEWLAMDFAGLQKLMESQRSRRSRLPVPSWEEVSKHLPPEAARRQPVKIRWSLVCMGYQPELAMAWSRATQAFAEESRQDRVFEETLFWVITRSIRCFY